MNGHIPAGSEVAKQETLEQQLGEKPPWGYMRRGKYSALPGGAAACWVTAPSQGGRKYSKMLSSSTSLLFGLLSLIITQVQPLLQCGM